MCSWELICSHWILHHIRTNIYTMVAFNVEIIIPQVDDIDDLALRMNKSYS